MVEFLDPPAQSETKNGPKGLKRRSRACITCRIRRVKCDYAIPSCKRCLSTGRKCDGYPAPPGKRQDPPPAALLVVINSPGAVSSQCDREAVMAFKFFVQFCAPGMLNYGSYYFWNERVLQACHVDESIKHLTIAASRLGKYRMFQQQQPCRQVPSDQDTVFLWHYGKALKLLSRSKNPDPGFLLMACLLLILCDEFQENSFAAIQHVIAGRKILAACRPTGLSPSPQRSSGSNAAAIAELDQIFSRLELHTSEVYTMARPQSMSWWSKFCKGEAPIVAADNLPLYYPSLDRRQLWTRIEEAARALQEIGFECTALQLDGSPPQTRFQIVPDLTDKLNAWLDQLAAFESSMCAYLTSAMLTDLHLLRAYHLCLHVLSRCAPFRQGGEAAFDAYPGTLEHVVVSCSLLMRRRRARLMPMLFLVATRYRNASFRRRAIDMLRQCGLDGQILAKIALRVVRLEESGLVAPIVSSDIPLANRIRLVNVGFDGASTGSYLLRFTRHPYRTSSGSQDGNEDKNSVPLEHTALSTQACFWPVPSTPQTSSHAVSSILLASCLFRCE